MYKGVADMSIFISDRKWKEKLDGNITVLDTYFRLSFFVCVFFGFFFFEPESLCHQAGMQWGDLGSLQPHLSGSSDSPALAS